MRKNAVQANLPLFVSSKEKIRNLCRDCGFKRNNTAGAVHAPLDHHNGGGCPPINIKGGDAMSIENIFNAIRTVTGVASLLLQIAKYIRDTKNDRPYTKR